MADTENHGSTNEAEILDALEELIRILSKNKVSYAALATRVQSTPKWTESALKAFMARKGAVPINNKLRSLADEVEFQIMELPDVYSSPSVKRHLDTISSITAKTGARERYLSETLTREIGRSFQRIRNSGSHDDWPKQLAFARMDWADERIIVLMIEIRGSRKGHSFVMRIEGRRHNRRIIVGDILKCAGKTYFSGLAYNVIQPMETSEFFGLEAFDHDEIKRIINPKVIGLECFSVKESEGSDAYAPVNFHGLDGAGDPICGIGVQITHQNFERFGIDPSSFTSVFSREENKELAQVLDSLGAKTIAPRQMPKR